MTDVFLVALILLPMVLAYFLKSNASTAFLALCGGFTVLTLSGSDIEQLVGKTRITSLTSNNIDLALLAVPLLVTLLLTYRSVTSKNKRYFQTAPALCSGALLAIVAGPMLSDSLAINFSDSPLWKDLQNAQTYIVAIGLLSSLILTWSGHVGHSHHSKKHK
jgi:hypothetical protein